MPSLRILAIFVWWMLATGVTFATPEFSGGSEPFAEPAGPPPVQIERAPAKRTPPPTRPLPRTVPTIRVPVGPPLSVPPPLRVLIPALKGSRHALAASRSATVVVRAAGQTFRVRGRILDELRASVVAVNDPALSALFALYGASIKWDGASRAVQVTAAGHSVALPEGAADIHDLDGQPVHLDVPVATHEGVAWMPVAALPLVLEGKLQGVAQGQYLFDPLVTDVSIDSMEGGGARLTIESPLPIKWTSFMLRRPNRYVLNLPNAVLDLDKYKPVQTRSVSHPEIGHVRFDQFSFQPNVVRLVIPLQDEQELNVLPSSTPRKLVVAIARPQVTPYAENFSEQRITDMRVDKTELGVKVTLTGTGPFQYEYHRLKEPDNRFFLDISQAVLAGPRREVEVADSYVTAVKLNQYQKDPVPAVRLLLEMEKPAETKVFSAAPNVLVIETRHRVSMTDVRGVGATRMPTGRRVICIDAGHGGSDPGALNHALGIYEKTITLDIAHRLARVLREQGWQVVMTRSTDRDVSYAGSSANEELGARVRVAHDFKADLFVSIHCNSSRNRGVTGTSTHWSKASDRILASFLHPRVVSAMGCPSRGLQRNNFYVLRHCRLPAVLIETAFISNNGEGRKLADPDQRQRLAEGIAEGLRVYVVRNGGLSGR
ncbi:MAG: AMIN domain-containing protein [Armatimonadetes bacterium]|nr:AMIN domain-containing protein [Armatimonadota bacterium]